MTTDQEIMNKEWSYKLFLFLISGQWVELKDGYISHSQLLADEMNFTCSNIMTILGKHARSECGEAE